MNDIEVYSSKDENIYNIKFDKTITNFLERNSYETYNFLDQDISIEENNIDFIKINHISYDRDKENTDINLIDFQQMLSAISSKSKEFVYIIESNEIGASLYLGTTKHSIDFLNTTFNGIYSGSEIQINEKPKFEDNKYLKAMSFIS